MRFEKRERALINSGDSSILGPLEAIEKRHSILANLSARIDDATEVCERCHELDMKTDYVREDPRPFLRLTSCGCNRNVVVAEGFELSEVPPYPRIRATVTFQVELHF